MASGPQQDLQDLHNRCVHALQRYMAEAGKTCGLLKAITEFPVSMETRLAILNQRQMENQAQQHYLDARALLFGAARWE